MKCFRLAFTALALIATAIFFPENSRAADPLLEKQDLFEAGQGG